MCIYRYEGEGENVPFKRKFQSIFVVDSGGGSDGVMCVCVRACVRVCVCVCVCVTPSPKNVKMIH